MQPVFIVGGAIALLLLLTGGAAVAAEIVLHHTLLNDEGLVTLDGTTPADPEQLATDAGMTVDAYAGARMVQAEAGGLPESGRAGVYWAAKNYAESVGKSLSAVLLKPTGFFGSEKRNPYASTARDPNEASLSTVRKAEGGELPDPTGGATHWDSPWSYKNNPETGETAQERADRFAANRRSEGLELFVLDDVPERHLRFWRPA